MNKDLTALRKRVAIVTNNVNCERHVQYYATIEKYFIINGWEIADDFNVDKVILCGCGFHDIMHEKVVRTVDHLKNINFLENNAIVMGCQSKTHEPELEKNLKVRLIPFGEEKELDKITNAVVPFDQVSLTNLLRPYIGCKIDKENEFFHIQISKGCLRQCTFCVINKAKGYIRSNPLEDIVKQYKAAVERGNRRIYLMGEDTFAYGIDKNTTIIELAETLLKIDPDVELCFGSLHIRWLLEYSEGIMALCKKGVVKELHVGLQHINDSILKRMGRPIVFADVHKVLLALKKECPDLYLEADILVGFPGETEEQYKQLVDFFKTDRCFNNVRHFGFSDVKGAPSFNFKDKHTTSEIVARWEEFDKALKGRSANFKDEEATTMDVAFQLTHERDYNFCKDSFDDEYEKVVDAAKFVAAKPTLSEKEDNDFGF
ncbi:MAG: radical SAM protein [bacterium]|nr:radical SAM protein [bacterium]